MRKIHLIILLLFPLLVDAGGGWTYKKGHGFFKLGQNYIHGANYFNPGGRITEINPPINIYTTSFYGEYGIADRLNVLLYAPFFMRLTQNGVVTATGERVKEEDSYNGIADIDVAVKYGLIQDKRIVLSTLLLLGLPTGENAGGVYDYLQTGDGEFNQMIRIDAGMGFSNALYTTGYVGFNNRTRGFSDEFRYGLEIGLAKKKLIALIRFQGIKPFGESDPDIIPVNGIFNNRIEYLSFTPEILYRITDKWGVSASAGGAFYGKHVLANPNYGLGIFLEI